MKVELELTENQLKDLDKGLEDLLRNLTDEQKIELIKGYMEKTLNNIYYEQTDSFYSSKKLSSFGEEITHGLQDKVKECIADNILQNSNIQEIVDSTVNSLRGQLPRLVQESISRYIIDHLFQSKEDINQDLYFSIQRYMCEHNPNNYR